MMEDLAIANFSIILARLNHALKLRSRNSYVDVDRVWLRQGRYGFVIIKDVWRESDIPVRTHQEMLAFLVYGSTTLRYALHLIQKVVLADQDVPGHKKLLLGEAYLVCAWYTEVVLRHTHIHVTTMHSGLSQMGGSELADRVNEPSDILAV